MFLLLRFHKTRCISIGSIKKRIKTLDLFTLASVWCVQMYGVILRRSVKCTFDIHKDRFPSKLLAKTARPKLRPSQTLFLKRTKFLERYCWEFNAAKYTVVSFYFQNFIWIPWVAYLDMRLLFTTLGVNIVRTLKCKTHAF